MKRKVMLIPVGEQIQPLLYGLRYFKELDEIVLLFTSKTEQQCEKIKKTLSQIPLAKKIVKLKSDAKSLSNLLTTLLSHFSTYDLKNLEIISNVTGGTKPMALACYLFSCLFKGYSFYIFKKNEEMEFVEVPLLRISLWEELNPKGKRFKILKILESGRKRLVEISKLINLREPSTLYYLEELEEKGLIKRKEKKYELSEIGKLAKAIIELAFNL